METLKKGKKVLHAKKSSANDLLDFWVLWIDCLKEEFFQRICNDLEEQLIEQKEKADEVEKQLQDLQCNLKSEK